MNETIINPYTIITVISFLAIFVMIAFFIRKKSGSLKKIINNKKINIVEYLPIRGGFSAIIFSVENEKFFFVGHKSGRGSLTQIDKFEFNKAGANDIITPKQISKDISQKEKKISANNKVSKPLQHVNISDLLTAHKKGNKDA